MGKIDWNRIAYNVGQMAGDGVNKANDLIDAGERKVRESMEKYRQGQEDSKRSHDQQPRVSPQLRRTSPPIDMEEMKDAQDRIKGWFGPNRVVRVDMSDGSFAYYKIHDTQRTEDAVYVMSQILINRLEAVAPKADFINAQDPHEEDVRVIITIDKSVLETGSPTYDDRTVLSEIVATLYSYHAQDSHVLGIETVPYSSDDRRWPWDPNDQSKWTLQAAEHRPRRPIGE